MKALHRKQNHLKQLFFGLSVVFLYVISGAAGKEFALVEGGNVYAFWPPTGIALGALIIRRVPLVIRTVSVLLGAFLFNYAVAANPLALAGVIAMGNALGPLLAYRILSESNPRYYFIESPGGMVALIGAAVAGALVSSTNGALALFWHSFIGFEQMAGVVWTWFTGDFFGYLVVTPVIAMVLHYKRVEPLHLFQKKSYVVAGVLLFFAAFVFAGVVFVFLPHSISYRGLEYLPFILLVIGVFFLEVPGAIVGAFVLSLIAVIGTASGSGPFYIEDIPLSLLMLQLYIGINTTLMHLLGTSLLRQERARAALRETNLDLEQRINMAVQENREKDRLIYEHSKHQAISELLMNLAHHWRQPLNACAIEIQNIEDVLGEPDEIKKKIDFALHELQDLSYTITRFSRLYNTEGADHSVTVQEALDLTLELARKTLDASSVSVILNVPSDLSLRAQTHELVELFSNLFLNVRDAVMYRKRYSATIYVNVFSEGNNVVIQMRDDAGGIEPDLLPDRLYSPYVTTHFKSREKGLGMYNVYTIVVYKLGGTIEAKNTQNGAEILIRIPHGK